MNKRKLSYAREMGWVSQRVPYESPAEDNIIPLSRCRRGYAGKSLASRAPDAVGVTCRLFQGGSATISARRTLSSGWVLPHRTRWREPLLDPISAAEPQFRVQQCR